MAATAEPEMIEREAVMATSAELAAYLQGELGQQLTAYLTGLRDAKMVGRWAGGKSAPREAANLRLRYAFRIARMLIDAYGADTAKAWLVGANTRLDDEAPASVLRHAQSPEDLRRLVPAARAFVGAAG